MYQDGIPFSTTRETPETLLVSRASLATSIGGTYSNVISVTF